MELMQFEKTLVAFVALICLGGILWLPATASAQQLLPKAEKNEKKASPGLRVSGLVQIAAGWTDRESDPAGGRPAISAHRARVWLRGTSHRRVRYLLHLGADRLGADQFSLLQGKPLGASRLPTVLDAMVQVDALEQGKLRLTGGFMRPAVGRESNTTVPFQPTHEIALTGVLARASSVGAGHGRAPGLNIGGQLPLGPLDAVYQFGVAAPTLGGSTADGINYSDSLGGEPSVLVAGTISIGAGYLDQMRAGGLLLSSSSLKRANSWLVGASGCAQGQTDSLKSSRVLTVFGAARLGGLHLDAEWVSATRVTRTKTVSTAGTDPETILGASANNVALHARIGYTINVDQMLIIPFATYSSLSGAELDASLWKLHAGSLNLFAGASDIFDVGVNWHVDSQRLRLGAHLIKASISKESDAAALKQPVSSGMSALLTAQASF